MGENIYELGRWAVAAAAAGWANTRCLFRVRYSSTVVDTMFRCHGFSAFFLFVLVSDFFSLLTTPIQLALFFLPVNFLFLYQSYSYSLPSLTSPPPVAPLSPPPFWFFFFRPLFLFCTTLDRVLIGSRIFLFCLRFFLGWIEVFMPVTCDFTRRFFKFFFRKKKIENSII